MQFNILIISLLLTTPLFAEQRLLTHLTAERNDSVWFAELTYNRQNRLLNATITLSVSGENPKNWQRIEQKFDGEKLTSRSQFVWKNGVWANQRRTIWNYSGENIAREIEQIGTATGWTTIWQTENQFVDNRLKISTLATTKNGKTRRIRTTFSESNGTETIAFEVDTAGVWQPFGTATLSENSRQKLLTFEQNGQNVSPLRFVTYKNNRGETHQIQTEKGWENLACLVRENGQNGIVWLSLIHI